MLEEVVNSDYTLPTTCQDIDTTREYEDNGWWQEFGWSGNGGRGSFVGLNLTGPDILRK